MWDWPRGVMLVYRLSGYIHIISLRRRRRYVSTSSICFPYVVHVSFSCRDHKGEVHQICGVWPYVVIFEEQFSWRTQHCTSMAELKLYSFANEYVRWQVTSKVMSMFDVILEFPWMIMIKGTQSLSSCMLMEYFSLADVESETHCMVYFDEDIENCMKFPLWVRSHYNVVCSNTVLVVILVFDCSQPRLHGLLQLCRPAVSSRKVPNGDAKYSYHE